MNIHDFPDKCRKRIRIRVTILELLWKNILHQEFLPYRRFDSMSYDRISWHHILRPICNYNGCVPLPYHRRVIHFHMFLEWLFRWYTKRIDRKNRDERMPKECLKFLSNKSKFCFNIQSVLVLHVVLDIQDWKWPHHGLIRQKKINLTITL